MSKNKNKPTVPITPQPPPDSPPGRDRAGELIGQLAGLEQSLKLLPGLTPKDRISIERKVATVGEPAIERALQLATENGGKIGDVDFNPTEAAATIEYTHAFGPVGQRYVELGLRFSDDVLQRQESLAEKVILAETTLKKRSRRNPTLLTAYNDIHSLRPARHPRPKKDAGSGSGDTQGSATDPQANASGASAGQPATVVVVHGETPGSTGGAGSNGSSGAPSNGAANGSNGASHGAASNGSAAGSSNGTGSAASSASTGSSAAAASSAGAPAPASGANGNGGSSSGPSSGRAVT